MSGPENARIMHRERTLSGGGITLPLPFESTLGNLPRWMEHRFAYPMMGMTMKRVDTPRQMVSVGKTS